MKKRLIVFASVCLCLVMIGAWVVWGAGTVTKGLIGKQDIYLWDGVSDKTFTRTTSSGYSLTMSKFLIPGSTAVDVEGVYGGKTCTELAAAISDIGSNEVALWFSLGTWTLDCDQTVPANIRLNIPYGTELQVSSGKTLTIYSPAKVDAGSYQIFGGSGSVAFTNPGEIYHEWFGTDGDALGKCYTAGADGSVVSTHVESITLDTCIDHTTKTMSWKGLSGTGTTITSSAACVFKYSDKTSNHENFYIRDFTLDGDDSGTDGIVINDAAMARIENVKASNFTNAGFVVENSTTGLVIGVNFYNCGTGGNAYGWLLHGSPQNVAYQLVGIYDSFAYGNEVGLYAYGDYAKYKFLIDVQNFEVEANTVEGIRLRNGASLNCNTCYLEQNSGAPDYNYIDYTCDNGTYAKFTNSRVTMMPGDGNSSTTDTILEHTYSNAMGWIVGPSRLGRQHDSTCFGSPHWRAACSKCTETQGGSQVAKGQVWVDSAGNKWKAHEDGTSGNAGWDFVGHKLIFPIDYSDFSDQSSYGINYFCFETPTLVTEAYFVVTETFSGGTATYLTVGSGGSRQSVWFSYDQLESADLVAGAVIRGSHNSDPSAYLTSDNGATPSGKYLTGHTGMEVYAMLQAGTFNTDATSCVLVYPSYSGAFQKYTAGAGYIVFDAVALQP